MKEVLYKKFIPSKEDENGYHISGTGKYEEGFSLKGYFHMFINELFTDDNGVQSQPMAIIQTEEGTVITVSLHLIKFNT